MVTSGSAGLPLQVRRPRSFRVSLLAPGLGRFLLPSWRNPNCHAVETCAPDGFGPQASLDSIRTEPDVVQEPCLNRGLESRPALGPGNMHDDVAARDFVPSEPIARMDAVGRDQDLHRSSPALPGPRAGCRTSRSRDGLLCNYNGYAADRFPRSVTERLT